MRFFLLCLFWIGRAACAQSGDRVALVIGNSEYPGNELVNPRNDANAMAELLRRAGFTVDEQLDTNLPQLHAAVARFGQTIRDPRVKFGLFYYAGHGFQLDWHNYLIPVSVNVHVPADVPKQTVDVSYLLRYMEQAQGVQGRSFLIILDACRVDPFAGSLRSPFKGLSQFDAPPGSLLAFATAPGTESQDGEGTNGLYTGFLLNELAVTGARLEDAFKRVRLSVRMASHGTQIPWESTSLEEDLYLFPHISRNLTEAEKDQLLENEMTSWLRIKSSADPEVLAGFIREFPSGSASELAQSRMNRLLTAMAQQEAQRLRVAAQSAAAGAKELAALIEAARSRAAQAESRRLEAQRAEGKRVRLASLAARQEEERLQQARIAADALVATSRLAEQKALSAEREATLVAETLRETARQVELQTQAATHKEAAHQRELQAQAAAIERQRQRELQAVKDSEERTLALQAEQARAEQFRQNGLRQQEQARLAAQRDRALELEALRVAEAQLEAARQIKLEAQAAAQKETAHQSELRAQAAAIELQQQRELQAVKDSEERTRALQAEQARAEQLRQSGLRQQEQARLAAQRDRALELEARRVAEAQLEAARQIQREAQAAVQKEAAHQSELQAQAAAIELQQRRELQAVKDNNERALALQVEQARAEQVRLSALLLQEAARQSLEKARAAEQEARRVADAELEQARQIRLQAQAAKQREAARLSELQAQAAASELQRLREVQSAVERNESLLALSAEQARAELARLASQQQAEAARLAAQQLSLLNTGIYAPTHASLNPTPFFKGYDEHQRQFSVGDEFDIRVIDLYSKVSKPLVMKVTQVDLEAERITYNSGEFVSDLMGNTTTNQRGLFSTPRQFYPAELILGKKWHTRFKQTRQSGTTYTFQYDLKVVAKETITVPAGTFETYKIEARGFNVELGAALERNIWVAPGISADIAHEIKVRLRNGSMEQNDRQELVALVKAK